MTRSELYTCSKKKCSMNAFTESMGRRSSQSKSVLTAINATQYAGKIRRARLHQNMPAFIEERPENRAATNGRYSRHPELMKNTATPMSICAKYGESEPPNP